MSSVRGTNWVPKFDHIIKFTIWRCFYWRNLCECRRSLLSSSQYTWYLAILVYNLRLLELFCVIYHIIHIISNNVPDDIMSMNL